MRRGSTKSEKRRMKKRCFEFECKYGYIAESNEFFRRFKKLKEKLDDERNDRNFDVFVSNSY